MRFCFHTPPVPLVVLGLALACKPGTPPAGDAGSPSTSSPSADRAAVEAAVQRHWTAINAGDTATVGAQHTPDLTIIMAEVPNRFVIPSATADSLFPLLIAAKPQFTVADLQVQLYGDVGVASFYLAGAVRPDGTPDPRPRRVTEVWVRQADGGWKETHHHDSVLAN